MAAIAVSRAEVTPFASAMRSALCKVLAPAPAVRTAEAAQLMDRVPLIGPARPGNNGSQPRVRLDTGGGLAAVELAIRTAMTRLGASLLERLLALRLVGRAPGPRRSSSPPAKGTFTPCWARSASAGPGITAHSAGTAGARGRRPRRGRRVNVAGPAEPAGPGSPQRCRSPKRAPCSPSWPASTSRPSASSGPLKPTAPLPPPPPQATCRGFSYYPAPIPPGQVTLR